MQTIIRAVACFMAVYGFSSMDLWMLFWALILWEFAGGFVASFIFIVSGFGNRDRD